VRKVAASFSRTPASSPVKTTQVSRRTATSPAIDGPTMADQETCSLTSWGTCSARTSGRVLRLPSSSASIPLVTAITITPGLKSNASCSLTQRSPKELTPLITIWAPSKASSASSN
jgi:hypothetical protein